MESWWHWWHVLVGAVLVVVAWIVLRTVPAGRIYLPIAVVAVGGLVLALPWTFRRIEPRAAAVAVGTSVAALGLVVHVGANDPGVRWLGSVHVHGPRDGNQVALTFDDGPNPKWTLAVAEILDGYGVKGTFFQIGKAIDAYPEVAQSLHERGHLLGNHSYHHDAWRWLDPRYPELERTQDAFRRRLGICPALFRPPHGQRTPFMLHHVRNEGLATVMWDVSAEDWLETDGRRVAERILDQVRPGSIILLHDGLDLDPHADRSVLRTALPLILDGLAAKGLHPVRLDDLLDLPAYQPCSG